MSQPERTQAQTDEQQQRALQLSMKRSRPPVDIPGFEIQSFLGSGAYGEVWVGIDQNTGRRVAIKIYTHRGGVDWSLLNREVEKLVFLSADRYVVQLLEVGWDANPPYYVMEYIEHGSLDDHLQSRGALPLREALDLFREVAIGLSHAHAKGVLHCDLKPANIMLDQDAKPRLADFGQSRLSTEQTPSLGTLFYMAPEQADLDAVPDARWDVYALGAILYCALVGRPPHRNDAAVEKIDSTADLSARLDCYRQVIRHSPSPVEHRRVPGMDRALASIIDGCLAADPERRIPSVQTVLEGLERREHARERRPMLVLGFLGPLLLLAIMALFGWRTYAQATAGRKQEIQQQAGEVNYFAAKTVASKAAEEITRYYRVVESLAADEQFQGLVRPLVAPQAASGERSPAPLLRELADPQLNRVDVPARRQFIDHPLRQPLQAKMDDLIAKQSPATASWFVCDARGTQLAAAFSEPAASTLGKNYSWRTYFHGGPDDLVRQGADGQVVYELPEPGQHITETHLSAAFQSKATNRWKVAVSTPIRSGDQLLGIVALTVDIGVFLRFEEGSDEFFAVLIDGRPGRQQGMILQHPQFEGQQRLPDEYTQTRVDVIPAESENRSRGLRYRDPLGEHESGKQRDWIRAQARVKLPPDDADSGLVVQVQQDFDALVEPLQQLGRQFVRLGLTAFAAVVLVVIALWTVVLRVARGPSATLLRPQEATTAGPTPLNDTKTLHNHRSDRAT